MSNDDKPAVTRNMLNLKDSVAVLDFLKAVCTQKGAFALYLASWTDETVAIKMSGMLGRPVTAHNVARVRVQMIGELASPEDEEQTDLDRMKLMDRQLTAILQTQGSIHDLLFALDERMGAFQKQSDEVMKRLDLAKSLLKDHSFTLKDIHHRTAELDAFVKAMTPVTEEEPGHLRIV